MTNKYSADGIEITAELASRFFSTETRHPRLTTSMFRKEMTKEQAYEEFELLGRGLDWEGFVSIEGCHETYDTQNVLSWLGY